MAPKPARSLTTGTLLVWTALLASAAIGMTPVEIKRDYGDAVVTIATYSAAEDAIGLGSGFIVDPSGVIVTCYHVINEAYPAVIKLLNGASFQEIRVLGCDSAKDVAVIKVNGRNLPTVKLARSDDVEVGERVVAIGNPRGLENTISDGLLSGVREMGSFNLLQISAPISPGSSGGPVFNSSGLVVGIASATLKESQNLNFCVPIRYARPLLACTSSVSLEEFSRGIKPSEAASSPSMAGDARREFLRALIPMLRSFWELSNWQRHDKYRRVVREGDGAQVMLGALLREEADDALRRCLMLRAPDAELRRILQRYTDLAQRRFDAYDIMLRAYSSEDEVSSAAGSAKLQNVQEELSIDKCADILILDLMSQYLLDAGIKMEELGSRLPSVFDSLPAMFAVGNVRKLVPGGAGALEASVLSSSISMLGFYPYLDEPGIVVDTVYKATWAEKAGLRRNDVVTGVNDTLRIGTMWDYYMFRAAQPAGVPFTLNVLRDGRPRRLTAHFASQ
ncbi:MAG: trypsin-like peptidase domain-containing protein [candidate division WOR-3 bacterium]|nr:trypsin-like peptidase domain-containing protein [candidate division WOR-3 bacterium]